MSWMNSVLPVIINDKATATSASMHTASGVQSDSHKCSVIKTVSQNYHLLSKGSNGRNMPSN